MCYELRDLRAVVSDFLRSLNIVAHLSEEEGFPNRAGDLPHVTCLRTLEDAQLVIGVLQQQYGSPFDDWGSYSQYKGLSPIHAEFRHAQQSGKKFLLYVHKPTLDAYYRWKADPGLYRSSAGRGPDVRVLEMVDEMATAPIPPWRVSYADVLDILKSLRSDLINEVYASLKEQEQQNRDQSSYFVQKILDASPDTQRRVQEQLNPDLISEIASLQSERTTLEQRLATTQQESQASIDAITREKQTIENRLSGLEAQLSTQRLILAAAAVKDASWLNTVRTTLMPKQPGKVPFHNDAEVALRGYHVSNVRGGPVLSRVSWSLLPDSDNDLHRGYRAALLFNGSGFAPGIVWAQRWTNGPSELQQHIWWRLPNIYFGDYLEVSTNDDPEESPISYLNFEFAVRNPQGEMSDWVRFTYSFDLPKLRTTVEENAALARNLSLEGKHAESVEPFRKAMVYMERLSGYESPEASALRKEWNNALDQAALAGLRFREGDEVTMRDSEHAGKSGTIKQLRLRHVKAYLIALTDGTDIEATDSEVAPIGS